MSLQLVFVAKCKVFKNAKDYKQMENTQRKTSSIFAAAPSPCTEVRKYPKPTLSTESLICVRNINYDESTSKREKRGELKWAWNRTLVN